MQTILLERYHFVSRYNCLKPCLLILLLFSVLLTPSLSTTLPDCDRAFACGSLQNITYPFTGGARPPTAACPRNRPASCGHPNFGLDCQSQAPLITINSIASRVLSIHISTRTLTVARVEFWNNPCPSPTHHMNPAQDTAHFAYSNDSQNVMIYYGCPALPSVMPPNQFSCITDGITTASYFVITSAGEVPDSGCTSSIVVHVNQAVAQGLMSVPPSITITEVLDRGFGLRWDTNDTICSECVQSGGVCGSGSGYVFACLCPAEVYPEACNST
ncbi:hypothetical protein C3L33_22943, partial [Rhododendron williamsianum]